MMALPFLGPILASVLYVIVFQKAGFRGGILAVCATPILGAALTVMMVRMMIYSAGPAMMLVPLITIPLALLPLILLAFMAWPPVSVAPSSSEK